jgi:hypothetical protein
MRSVYHVREVEVFKLAQLTGHIDIMLSHDWPRGIAMYGDTGTHIQHFILTGMCCSSNVRSTGNIHVQGLQLQCSVVR